MDNKLFNKYKTLEFRSHPDGMLFPINWDWVRENNRCPLCENKLYISRKYPDSIICRNRKHKFFKIKAWK